MTRLLAIGVLAFALTGCGTVQNFSDEAGGAKKPYGGVKIAIDRLKGEGDSEPVTRLIPEELTPLLWPIDVPLCAMGDTLTLPITVAMSVNHSRNYYNLHKGLKPDQIPNWLQDSQPTRPAPLSVPTTAGNAPNETGVEK